MKRPTSALQSLLAQRRGSALILTVLILLVLSGLGMVALSNVSRSVQQSGAYRVRAQADTFSEAAVDYATAFAGANADTVYKGMQEGHMGAVGVLNADDSVADDEFVGRRQALERVGPHLVLKQRPGEITQFGDLDTMGDTETGLVSGGGQSSFEASENDVEFDVVFRNPVDGPAIPGFDSECRYKKVTVASRGRVGQPDREWEGAGMFGEKRHGIEVFIGPINCGQQ